MSKNSGALIKADFEQRIFAYFIDFICICVVMTPVIASIFFKDFGLEKGMNFFIKPIIIISSFLLLQTFKDVIAGISPGKWIMGLSVRNNDNLNVKPPIWKLIVRNIPLIIYPVDMFYILTGKEQVRLGDKIAKTVVVKKEGEKVKVIPIIVIAVIFVSVLSFFVDFPMFSLKNNIAHKKAVEQLTQNRELIEYTGGIKEIKEAKSGSVNPKEKFAMFRMDIKGVKKDVKIQVFMEAESDSLWYITRIFIPDEEKVLFE